MFLKILKPRFGKEIIFPNGNNGFSKAVLLSLRSLMFADCSSQKSSLVQLVVKASGSLSPGMSGDPRLETTALKVG